MDFALDGTAIAVRDVAEDVFARRQPDWESTFGGRHSGGTAAARPEATRGGFEADGWQALVDAGLVTREQRGKWAYYTIVPETLAVLSGVLDPQALRAGAASSC